MWLLRCRVSIFFFKQKTAYEMRISDWSSDVCSSDLSSANRSTSTSWSPTRSPTVRCVRWSGTTGSTPWLHEHWTWVEHPLLTVTASGPDRKSVVEGKSVSVRVDLGGRQTIKKKSIVTQPHTVR